MKAKSLDRMDTEVLMQELSRIATEIKNRIKQDEKRIEATRHTMARTLGHLRILESSNKSCCATATDS
jgi:hypothetical protein